MKSVLYLLLIFFMNSQYRELFDSDVFVTDKSQNEINLRNIELSKDSLLILLWHHGCSPCIKELDDLQRIQIQKKLQVIVVAINLNKSFTEEIALIKKHNWPFVFYFDHRGELQEYLLTQKMMRSDQFIKGKSDGRYSIAVPQSYLFVKRILVSNKMYIKDRKITFEKI